MFGLSAAVVALMAAAPAAQAPARSIGGVLDTLDRVRAFHETAMSPDGKRVAWVEDVSAADGTTAIYLRTIGAPASETHAILASTRSPGRRIATRSRFFRTPARPQASSRRM
jgi:hypothetical protein